MEKTKLFYYVGENGVVLSPVEIPGAHAIVKYNLRAGENKMITRDGITLYKSINIAASDIDNWREVDGQE